jgi:tetratricopeptide (TPR) repeat protein
MKKQLIIFSLLVLFSTTLFGQTKPKKEKASTQNEMEAMMKEAQKALNEMSPEDKAMMDSLGLKMPSFKDVPKIGDEQLAKAYDKESWIVPKLYPIRIAAIPSITLNESNIDSYISSTHNKLVTVLNSETKILGDKIYTQLKISSNIKNEKGTSILGIWTLGYQELAVYVMGKVVLDDTSNCDNLNNYAAMLTMTSAEPFAIPILNNLNAKYKNNSTILNNLGQAWFGLGDIPKAENYLDNAIRIYAYHPQANLSKSMIEESKGNKTAAIAAVKNAVKYSYTNEKEARLHKLGYKLTGKDLNWKLPKLKTDALILSDFIRPEYPKTVEQCIISDAIWDPFREQCGEKLAALNQKALQLQDYVKTQREKRIKADLDLVKKSLAQEQNIGEFTITPFYASKALLKLTELQKGKNSYDEQLNQNAKKYEEYIKFVVASKMEYDKIIEDLNKKEGDQTGEGFANESFCVQKKEASDAYLSKVNTLSEKLDNERIDILRRKLNEEIYWYQYMQWPEEFEITKIQMQMTWLNAIQKDDFESITLYKCEKIDAKLTRGKLSEFDDVACKYHSEMKLGAMKITSDCSRMTTEIDTKFLKLGLKQDMDKKTFSDQFMNCTIEAKAEIGHEVEMGPVTAGASASGGIGMEIDRSGVKDVYLIGEAGVSTGVSVGVDTGLNIGPETSVSAGVSGRVSIITGSSSVGGSGIFEDVK